MITKNCVRHKCNQCYTATCTHPCHGVERLDKAVFKLPPATSERMPIVLDDATVAFPASVKNLMPTMDEIPEAFKRHHGTKWNDLMSAWFFVGLESLNLIPKKGIDKNTAMRHIRAVMGSFEPKHEHKEAAVAYLLSLWFEDNSTWEEKRKAETPHTKCIKCNNAPIGNAMGMCDACAIKEIEH